MLNGDFWKDGFLGTSLSAAAWAFCISKSAGLTRQDPAGLRQTLADDAGARYGTTHRTEGGRGPMISGGSSSQLFEMTVADKRCLDFCTARTGLLYIDLVQTLAGTKSLGTRITGPQAGAAWGSMGLPGWAHESKCPNLQRLANLASRLSGARPRIAACDVLGSVWGVEAAYGSC